MGVFFGLYLAIKLDDMQDYFMRKYKDLYDFFIALKDEFEYEPLVEHVE